MITPFLSSAELTFADVSSRETIYNEAGMNSYGTVIGKAARRVAAMARVAERSFARFPEAIRPIAF